MTSNRSLICEGLTCLLLVLMLVPVAVRAENLALVVGVSSYGDDRSAREEAGFIVPTKLPNAINDARLMHGALEAAGFSASLVEDPSKRQLLTAINRFAERLREAGPDALGFFYFAGHGAQGVPRFERDVDNFLMPLGTDLATETDLTDEAVGLSRISATLSGAGASAVILVLDACRNFALPSATRSGMVTRGLAEARAYPGTMIAYSTAPGELASDGPRGGNGPYAEALAKEVRAARGTRVEDILISVRQQVLAATSNRQTPWENASLRAKVTIGEPLQSQVAPAQSARVEGQAIFDSLWATCEYAMFARDYSSSPLAATARDRAGEAAPCDTEGFSLAVLGEGDYFPIVKFNAEYPARAKSRALEGSCVVQFTITRQGATRDPIVIEDECTSSLFHSTSIQAARKFRYKPRVIDGEAVEVPGVRNKFTYELSD